MQLYPTNRLPLNQWLAVTTTGKRSAYTNSPQHIVVQLSFTYHDDLQCADSMQLDLKHLVVCESLAAANTNAMNIQLEVADSIAFTFAN